MKNLRNSALLVLGLWVVLVAELYAGAWMTHAMPNAWFAAPTFIVFGVVFVVTAIVTVGTTTLFIEEATRDEP